MVAVNDFNAGRIVEIARSYGARVVQVRGERAKAKNVGVKLAKGEFVLFVDSDMELTPKVVEECLEAIESDEGIGGIIIPEF
ncbi:MAG: hypothetical protein DRJ47_09690 [Thermoprotei archaeon]|nr:MAG: hypothetical protein DRJ47_09690 [Thermoprotei archaeon]